MAVFLVNTCKFNSCGITFPTLQELIRHIEETHLNFDPQAMEEDLPKHPTCLPVSYVLRVFSPDYPSHKKEPTTYSMNNLKSKINRSHSPALSITSTTPTGSEMDEENYPSESEDSWSNVSTEGDTNLLKLMSSTGAITSQSQDKPYGCSISGCKKRYRNANGLKYHVKNAHPAANFPLKRESQDAVKQFRCDCGKEYKTAYGLKNHITTQHQPSAINKFQNPTSIRMDIIPMKQPVYDSSLSQTSSTNTSNSSGINLPSLQAADEPKIEISNMTIDEDNASDQSAMLRQTFVSDISIVKTEEVQEINSSPTLQHLLQPLSAKTLSN